MNEAATQVDLDLLPFFITAPGETDLLYGAVAVVLALVLVAFGAFYFTVQAIPDRLASGTSKAQMQLVGLLGLLSLFFMNNAFWVAGLLIAAVRIPDFMTPLNRIAEAQGLPSAPPEAAEPSPPDQEEEDAEAESSSPEPIEAVSTAPAAPPEEGSSP